MGNTRIERRIDRILAVTWIPTAICGLLGISLLTLGIGLWSDGPSDQDAAVVFAPLINVPIERLMKGSGINVEVKLPDTAPWKRIERYWGEPEYVVSAGLVGARSFAYCLPNLGLKISIMQSGHKIPIEVSFAPYLYSSNCAQSSIRFHAPPGSSVTLKIVKVDDTPLPHGNAFVLSEWPNMKDRLVGIDINRELRPFLIAASILGMLFIVLAGIMVSRHRSSRPTAKNSET